MKKVPTVCVNQTFAIYRVQIDPLVAHCLHHSVAARALRHNVARRLPPAVLDRRLGAKNKQLLAGLVASGLEEVTIALTV